VNLSAAKKWFVIGIAAWTAFAVLLSAWIDLRRLYEGQPIAVSDFVATLVQMYTLGLLTPVLVYVAHAFPPTRRPVILPLGMYLASLFGVCIVGLPLFALVSNTFLGRHFDLQTTLEEGFFTFLTYTAVLTIVVAVTQVQIANERSARALRLEADLSSLRLEALQRQIHPHFIFNTLHAVGAIMHTDVTAAEEMIAALADLLRAATDRSSRPTVPLREELTLLDRYALIMKMRYGDRLVVRISAEPRTLEIPFPTFTLQPLVENAIVHGLEETSSGIAIDVSCRLLPDSLLIDVSDDGATPDTFALQEGIGIGNTRARLAELYGNRAALSIGPRETRGVRFTLTVPTVPVI
jgi:two-component system, LytTR family, sensor kinase